MCQCTQTPDQLTAENIYYPSSEVKAASHPWESGQVSALTIHVPGHSSKDALWHCSETQCDSSWPSTIHEAQTVLHLHIPSTF